MSGIEVVGLVASIVSAFSAAATLYRDWRYQRRARNEESANRRLARLMSSSGSRIQEEYDNDFYYLGRMFSTGDGIARHALMEQLIIMQQTVIALLTDRRAGDDMRAIVHYYHDDIYDASCDVREDTLSVLEDLYQRISTAAPIPNYQFRPYVVPVPNYPVSSEIVRIQPVPPNCGGRVEKVIRFFRPSKWACRACGWSNELGPPAMVSADSRRICTQCWCKKFHFNDGPNGMFWRCFLCGYQTDAQDRYVWARHLSTYHPYGQILPGGCEHGQDECGSSFVASSGY